MGFTAGFTGGVTLTLSLAYLAILTHQRNRQSQGDVLRTQSYILSALARDPTGSSMPEAFPPVSRAELASSSSLGLVDAAKDRWNREVAGAARWAQTTDWEGVRANAERRLARLFGVELSTAAAHAEETVERAAGDVRAAAGRAWEDTRATAGRAAETAATGAAQAKETSKGLFTRGVEMGREVVDRAKAAVALVEEKASGAVQNAAAAAAPMSDVERALAQRYQKSDAFGKSVEEALSERYTPVEKRDNGKLRGL